MARTTKASESIITLETKPSTAQDMHMTQIEEPIDDSSHSRSRCGGTLRAEREKQALSTQDVANKLRLSTRQIEAIEADNYASLPEPTIVRGFIRNYAKLLKINAEPLLDAYTVIVPSNMPYQLTIKPTSNMHVSSKDKPKASSYILAVLATLLILGAWLFYQNYVVKPNPTAPIASINKAEPLPETALPVAERAPELQSSTELTLPAADTTILPAPSVAGPTVAASAQAPTAQAPTTPIAIIAADTNTPVAAATMAAPLVDAETADANISMAKLEINASQQTWVSVIDADGKQIYDQIIFAGSRETIEAKPPINVVLGNASGASLNLNGKTVDLGPHTRNNVARIKLE